MNRHQRELCLIIVSVLSMGAIVSYFFHILNQGKKGIETSYSLIFPTRPEAVLQINDTKILAFAEDDNLKDMNLFVRCIPDVFLSIIRQSRSNDIVFSFHPQGVLFFSRMDEFDARHIKSILRRLSDGYPPNKQMRDGVEIYYYKDDDAGFWGMFYKNGICVCSRSSVLLEKSIDKFLQPVKDNYGLYECIGKTSAKSAGDLWLCSPLEGMEKALSDTDRDETLSQWLHADLYSNDDRITAFTVIPFKGMNDSTATVIANSLKYKLADLFKIDSDSMYIQQDRDDDDLYIKFLFGK